MKSLLVEDNPADARLICEILWEAPPGTFETEQIERLDGALKRLSEEHFDIVLADLGLPDSQGMETLSKLLAAAGDSPVLVLTGLKDQSFAIQSVRAGAADYLVKGHFGPELLVRSIYYAIERKRIERALKAERQRLLDVLETMPAMICLLTQDYHVSFANRAFREHFGEANGRHCYEYRFGQTAPCRFCESFTPLQTGKPHHWELQTPDGRVIEAFDQPFADAEGSRLILEMDMDVTRQRQREQLIRLQADQHATLTATTADGYWRYDVKGKLLDVNEAYLRMSGYTREEFLKLHIADIEAMEGPEDILRHIQEVLKTGFDRFESKHRKKSGEVFDVEISASYWKAANQLLLFARDITERKQSQEALARSHGELLRFNQLAVGRELRMVELKQQINQLCAQLRQPAPFSPDLLHEDFVAVKEANAVPLQPSGSGNETAQSQQANV